MTENIVVATRSSRLAVAQAELVAEAIRQTGLSENVELLKLSTTGDRQIDWSLEKEGGKGLFTKEIENAVLDGRADIAVHSAKDLPTEMVDRLTIAAYLKREQAHDVLVRREESTKLSFIASSSPRRRAQLKATYPCAAWKEIRGNVETRLNRTAGGRADATVLAAAGLARLGIREFPGLIFEPLGLREVVPAPGQGAIAIQSLADQADRFAALNHAPTQRAVEIERAFLAAMGGGCHSATAAHVIGRHLLVFHEPIGFREFEFGNGEVKDIESRVREIVSQLMDAHD